MVQIVEAGEYQPPPAGVAPVIRTLGLTKQYYATKAVDQAEFEVRAGEVFGLLGPNGSGKTTIIRLLLGLIKPTAGRAEVFGYDPFNQRANVLNLTSAIIEAPAMYPMMSGMDNLRAMAILSGVDNPEKRVLEVLEQVGMRASGNERFSNYSLGMKQRVCIASALLTQPRLLILDEPTNGLDPSGMAEIRFLIRQLASQGVTVLLSSHLLNEVQQVCNRVAILSRGHVIKQGGVNELLESNTSIYLRLRREDWEKAWYLVLEKGYGSRLRAEGEYLVVAGQPQEGGELNRLLATNGIFASEISLRGHSLEEYYLSLMAAQQPYYYPQPAAPGGYPYGNQ